ncbi:MAG: hypothetical protein L0Y56_18060 [Nitrospira sp.]|nr:hypothetical protein [Nitrospira sp.]
MAFTVSDYTDLVRLLAEHPEWRSELRRVILSEDLLTMPEAQRRTEGHLEALAEAQRRSEERLASVEERLASVEERLSRLESIVETLAEAQRQAEERLSRLESVVETLVEQVRSLVEEQRRTANTVSDLKGRMLEITYRDNADAYFGPLLRRLRVVRPHTLEETLEAHLSREEFKDILRLDLLVSGQPRYYPNLSEVWLAVEVSTVVDKEDIDRARRRADLLRQAGYQAIPTVAGEQVTSRAEDEAHTHKVVLLEDGWIFLWEEALQAWAT